MRAFGILVLVLALLPAAGCDDVTESEATTNATAPAPEIPKLPRIKWLEAHDSTTPERWLASRQAKEDLPETDAAVEAMRAKLKHAARRFGDPPRMIANRAVQLEEMLAAQGIAETAPELIGRLTAVTSEVGPKEGFGSLCQHYFNLRQQGVGREAALEQLKHTSLLAPRDPMHRG